MGEYNPPHESLKMDYDGKHFRARISTQARPNQSINYLIDSGSCRNLIRVNMLGIVGSPRINYQNKIIMSGISNVDIETLGSVDIDLKIGKTVYKTTFQVLRDLFCPAIIGSSFLKSNTLYISQEFEYIVLRIPSYSNEEEYSRNQFLKHSNDFKANQINLISTKNETGNHNSYILSTGANLALHNKTNNSNQDESNNSKELYDINEISEDEEFEFGQTVAEIHHDMNNELENNEINQIDKLNRESINNYNSVDNFEFIDGDEIHEYNSENYDDQVYDDQIETSEFCQEYPQEMNLEYNLDYDVMEMKNHDKLTGKNRTVKIYELIKTEHLSGELNWEIKNILQDFNEIFFLDGDELTYTNLTKHDIETTTEIPINKRQYRFPESTKKQINEQIVEMLKLGIIRPSKSPWNAPVLCIPKKDLDVEGKKRYRIVVDFRALNTITKRVIFPIPLINEILDNIGEAQYFSTIDLKSGFYQIPINPKDAAKTAFSTPTGHYEFERMPMGLSNSPATFQKFTFSLIYSIQPVNAFVYLDDIIVFGKTIEEHNESLYKVFKALYDNNLKVEPAKCKILHKEVKYLGHIISKDGIRPTSENIEAIKNMKRPQTIRNVRSFLGTVNFYGKFIPNIADKRKPLNELLKKNVKFIWSAECETAFEELKNYLISEPVLVRPNFDDKFVLTTDASDYAIGAVLTNEKSNDHPIAYASRALIGAERKYFTIEKELLAIVWAVDYFKHYIYNQNFIVYTDHRPLVALWHLKETSPTLTKLRLKIQGIGCEIRYKQGKENIVADFLSRLNTEEDPTENEQSTAVVAITTRQQAKKDAQIDSNNQILKLATSPISDQNNFMDGLQNISTHSNDDDEDSNANNQVDILSFKDFKDTEINFNVVKFSKIIIPFEQAEATFLILNSVTAHKELSKYIDLPHGIKDYTKDNIFSFPSDKIWGVILNGTYRSIIKIQEFFKDLMKSFDNCPDFAKDASVIQIISHRIFKSEQEINLLRFFATKNSKTFTLFATNKDRIFVKPEDRDQVLKDFHDAPLGGHVGGKRMLKRISPLFTWENMKRDVLNYVKQCDSCQKNKIWPANKMPMKITSTSYEPFDKIYMDVVMLPVSTNGYNCGLVIQDDLSRFLIVAPMENQESATVARTFVEQFICKFGAPKEVVSDRGTNFVSKLMQHVCKILHIKKIVTSAYHPQANLVERSNRELKIYLRNFIGKNPQCWDELIPYFMFEYNSTENSSTGYSPHELLYGRKPTIPSSIYKINDVDLNYDDYVRSMKIVFKDAHETARENLILSKEKRKEIYDKKTNDWVPMWGDRVLVQMVQTGIGQKLQQKWRGPYEIVKFNSDQTTTIKNGNKLESVHNNRLRKYND